MISLILISLIFSFSRMLFIQTDASIRFSTETNYAMYLDKSKENQLYTWKGYFANTYLDSSDSICDLRA